MNPIKNLQSAQYKYNGLTWKKKLQIDTKCCWYHTDVIWRYFEANDVKRHEAESGDTW